MNTSHLTTVTHEGVNWWRATCLCGWVDDDNRLKRDAVSAAEMHWLREPLVTEVKTFVKGDMP